MRLLSASHHDLDEQVKQGLFRQDLYYRLNVIKLVVPPLRDRLDDLNALIKHIVDQLMTKQELTTAPEISDEAILALQQYTFPGNVRELENIIARAAAMCDENQIKPENLGLIDQKTDYTEQPQALTEELQQIERQRIEQALLDNRYNKTATAKQLGISFRALRYRLQKLGIN